VESSASRSSPRTRQTQGGIKRFALLPRSPPQTNPGRWKQNLSVFLPPIVKSSNGHQTQFQKCQHKRGGGTIRWNQTPSRSRRQSSGRQLAKPSPQISSVRKMVLLKQLAPIFPGWPFPSREMTRESTQVNSRLSSALPNRVHMYGQFRKRAEVLSWNLPYARVNSEPRPPPGPKACQYLSIGHAVGLV
jgi:hypothetical protein